MFGPLYFWNIRLRHVPTFFYLCKYIVALNSPLKVNWSVLLLVWTPLALITGSARWLTVIALCASVGGHGAVAGVVLPLLDADTHVGTRVLLTSGAGTCRRIHIHTDKHSHTLSQHSIFATNTNNHKKKIWSSQEFHLDRVEYFLPLQVLLAPLA